MNFDSHINGIVLATVELINAVTPGLRGGRTVAVPVGAPLTDAVVGALFVASRGEPMQMSESDAEGLAGWAARLRTVVELVEAGDVDAACGRLNAALQDAHAVPTLARHDGEPWHLHFHGPRTGTVEAWAAGMATVLAAVVGGEALHRLGVCTAPSCDRIYADTSRNGTRRFCGTPCQNRVKAAAFRARRTRP